MLEQRLEQDIKTAMLAGDKQRVTTLRGIKSVLLNAKVAAGTRETGLDDDTVVSLLSKEAKKRQESADLYTQGNSPERAQNELTEKKIIEEYLPAQLSEQEVAELVAQAIADTVASSMQDMGKVIGQVRAKAGASADGGLIARLVKEKLGV